MSEPVMTAEEWRRGMFVRYMEGGVALTDAGGIYMDDCSGTATVPASFRLPVAALCLHGRLTWEMVSALRSFAFLARAYERKDDDHVIMEKSISHGPRYFGEYGVLTVGHLRAAAPLADLLESLLPPREGAADDEMMERAIPSVEVEHLDEPGGPQWRDLPE